MTCLECQPGFERVKSNYIDTGLFEHVCGANCCLAYSTCTNAGNVLNQCDTPVATLLPLHIDVPYTFEPHIFKFPK